MKLMRTILSINMLYRTRRFHGRWRSRFHWLRTDTLHVQIVTSALFQDFPIFCRVQSRLKGNLHLWVILGGLSGRIARDFMRVLSIYSMNTNNTGFQTYKRLLQSARPYRLLFIAGVVGTIILSMTDAAFTGLIKPIIDDAFVKRNGLFIHWLPILIFGIFLIRSIASFVSTYFISRVARSIVRDMRRLIFSRLLHLPATFYDRNSSGYILSTIVYNVEQVAQACSDALLTCLRESSTAIGLIIVMFWVSWKLTLLFIVIAPLIAWVVKWSSVRMRRLSANVQQSVGDVTHVAGEGIDGYLVVRLYGGQKYEMEKFNLATKSNLQRELKIVVTNSVGTSSIQLLFAIPIAVTLLAATNPAMHISAGSFTAIVAG